MSTSYVISETESFTITHARHIASKVATDLLRFQRFYGRPSDETINAYEAELVSLLKEEYVDTVTYGFKRNDKWVAALRYRAMPGGLVLADDDPGKIKADDQLESTIFSSFLVYSTKWSRLTTQEQQQFEATLPFQRSTGPEPGIECGWWTEDRTYSAGGRGVGRSVIRRW